MFSKEYLKRLTMLPVSRGAFLWIIQSAFLYYTYGSPVHLPCEDTMATSACGRPSVQPFSMRIIGGQPAPQDSWPYMVSLREDGFLKCGGAVISRDLVLTATHCFKKEFPSEQTNKSTWTATMGKYRTGRDEIGQKTIKVSKIITHAGFDPYTVANDIALAVLAEPVTFSGAISPICLPPASQGVKVGEMCLLAGWGTTRGTSDQDVLNQVALPVISDQVCAQLDWYGPNFSQPKTTFCAGYEEGIRDGCSGDSGGPLICLRDNLWYIQGISSWGYGCGERKWPGIYTEVNKYISWIDDQVRKLRNNCPANPVIG